MITRKRRAAAKKKNTRVDFTPMVDMMMLLLTFFMFCTTLSKPQIMDIAMPTPMSEEELKKQGANTTDSQAITFLLAENNKVYYYEGVPNYDDYSSLKETDFTNLRNVLVNKNRQIVAQVNSLTEQKNSKKLTAQEYKDAVREVKKQKDGTVAVIKLTEGAVYKNLVDVLDEMAICSVGKYAVVDLAEGDQFLIENYKSKGLYAEGNR